MADFIKEAQAKPGEGAANRAVLAERELAKLPAGMAKDDKVLQNLQRARDQFHAVPRLSPGQGGTQKGQLGRHPGGKLGVDLSCEANNLRYCNQVSNSAQRWIGSRNMLEVGGVWIDEAFDAKMKTVTVKAMSKAYFRILERHKSVRNVFRNGNHLVWVTPSNTALIVDASNGQEEMSDADIDRLFVAARK